MFSLRTAKGRLAILAVLLLAFTMAACPADTADQVIDDTEEAADDVIEQAEDAADGVTDEGGDEDGADEGSADEGGDDEAEMTAQQVIAEAEEVDYESCHEANSAGGASDGVLFFPLPPELLEILTGVLVEIDVEKGDGSVVTVEGTLRSDGIVFLIPLSSFGEVITIVEVRVDGVVVDPGVVGTSYTVDPESSCENHPEVE